MIVRIVKLTFKPEETLNFENIFKNSQPKILKQNGCNHVELLRDINNPNIYFTYSHWKKTEDLEAYRSSELFKKVWAKTKILFNDKPQAWSVQAPPK